MEEQKIYFRGRGFVLNEKSKESEVLEAYKNCIGEIQVISDNVYSETYMDELKRYARRLMRTRNDFIQGFYYFAKFGVSKDLSTVVSNGKMLLADKVDKVRDDNYNKSLLEVLSKRCSEEESKESEVLEFGDFYLNVLQLNRSPRKREVLQAYRAGVENAQDISDRVNSVNNLGDLRELSFEVMEWRYAFIKGFEHFAKYEASQDLDAVGKNVASVLHDKAIIVKHDDLQRSDSLWR
ncbi:hypothetical protein HN681_04890 [archaeon]|jgi:hypothetical protein|nr:hypothetical protein [archaeon]MBT3730472.1 hypothetical protein [archaeon]MBT4670455.1 hypothetical protein [archaeon]MBT5030078.1 hypothetical protein [archaeon]MBT5288230.1 hypothetical protein [archaeon]